MLSILSNNNCLLEKNCTKKASGFCHRWLFVRMAFSQVGDPSRSVSEHKVNPKYVAFAMCIKYESKDLSNTPTEIVSADLQKAK